MEPLVAERLHAARSADGVPAAASPEERADQLPRLCLAGRRPQNGSAEPGGGPPALVLAFRTTYFVVGSERRRPGQQQLRFGSEGCLRSLKPFPPHGGLESVDGILRPADERRGEGGDELYLSRSAHSQTRQLCRCNLTCFSQV